MLEAPLPDVPPVNPEPEGVLQLYVVPEGIVPSVPFTGVKLKLTPLHQLVGISQLMFAAGLTVIVKE
jgi:hypothetical protein